MYSGGTALNLNGSQTLSVSGGTTHEYSVTQNFTVNGLTINGGANDVVVFNVTAGNAKFQGPVTLTGGITSDHVLFNVLSSGNNNVQSSGNYQNNVINADLIDLNGSWNVNEITINGRWFGEAPGLTYQLVSNGYIEQPVESPSDVPEPSTLAMMGTGFLGIAGVLRRKMRS
jgi:hypothetical protein